MLKLRLLVGLLALIAVGAALYVRAANASDNGAGTTTASDPAACDSCCGPIMPEPIADKSSAALPNPYSAKPASAPAKN